MGELSNFRDQSSDQYFLDQIGREHGYGSKQYNEFLKVIEAEKAAREFGLTEKEKSPLLKLVKKIIAQVDGVELEDGNKKQNKILEQQKKTAKDNIKSLLEFAVNYVKSIDNVGLVAGKKKYLDADAYRKEMEAADRKRRNTHNALFDQVAITSRYIIFHFSKLSESQMDKFEETEDKAGREILDVDRQQFPRNLIWPEHVNLKDRESVGKWALLISQELAGRAIEKF